MPSTVAIEGVAIAGSFIDQILRITNYRFRRLQVVVGPVERPL